MLPEFALVGSGLNEKQLAHEIPLGQEFKIATLGLGLGERQFQILWTNIHP